MPVPTGCIPVAMTVTAEFTEHSVSEASKIRKVVESSSVFNKVAETNKFSINASFGGFGINAALKSEWSKSIEETSKVEGSKEVYDETNTVFKEGFLQIQREVTKLVRIGEYTAVEHNFKYVDSVPIDKHENNEQLRERATQYIEAEYSHKQNNESAKIVGKYGNFFQMSIDC